MKGKIASEPSKKKSDISAISNAVRLDTIQNDETEKRRAGIFKQALRKMEAELSNRKMRLLLLTTPMVLAGASIAYAVSTHKSVELGVVATAASCASLAPQAIKTIRTRSAGDLSLLAQALFIGTTALWVTYGLQIGSVPIYVSDGTPGLFCVATAVVKVNELAKKNQNLRKNLAIASMPLFASACAISYGVATGNSNVAGIVGTVAIFGMKIPQVIKSVRTRSTGDLSSHSLAISAAEGSLWIAYGLAIHSPPVWASATSNLAQNSAIGVVKINETIGESRLRLPNSGLEITEIKS